LPFAKSSKMLAVFAASFLIIGTQGAPQGNQDNLHDEEDMSGPLRRVDWATLSNAVTIRHFKSSDFPVNTGSTADMWQRGENVGCVVEGSDLIDGERPSDEDAVNVRVTPPANWQVKPMKAFTHGWTDTVNGESGSSYPFFLNAWKYKYGDDYDFLLIDWHPIAEGEWEWPPSAPYDQGAKNAIDVGRYVGLCLGQLAKEGLLDNNIHLVGHSLGAHLMGKAGRVFEGQTGLPLMRITGLDPAGPRWVGTRPIDQLGNNTLGISSASFVDIIHSNGHTRPQAATIYPSLGAGIRLGHMDFFPDGGFKQLGCGHSLLAIYKCNYNSCDHSRSIRYYYWSLYEPFYFESMACGSVDDCFNQQPSDGTTIAYMGEMSYEYWNGGEQLLYTRIKDQSWEIPNGPTEEIDECK